MLGLNDVEFATRVDARAESGRDECVVAAATHAAASETTAAAAYSACT